MRGNGKERPISDREMVEAGIQKLFEPRLRATQAAQDKYRPLVRRLSDTEFIGLFLEVMAERPHRQAKALAMIGGALSAEPDND